MLCMWKESEIIMKEIYIKPSPGKIFWRNKLKRYRLNKPLKKGDRKNSKFKK